MFTTQMSGAQRWSIPMVTTFITGMLWNYRQPSSSYAAALVELKAMGEPEVVCEPGYMPIT